MNNSDTRSLLRQLRDCVPLLPGDLSEVDQTNPRNQCLIQMVKARPSLIPILTRIANQVKEWRQNENAGLYRVDDRRSVQIETDRARELFARDRFGFCLGISEAMMDSTLAALEANRIALHEEIKEFEIQIGNTQTIGDYLYTQILPGLLVTTGLIYVAICEQANPNTERTKRIVSNTTPLLLEWASQAISGHTFLKYELAWASRPTLRLYGELTLLDPEKFVLVEGDSPSERLEFSQPVLSDFAARGLAQVRRESTYRVGCLGLLVQVAGIDMIRDSVNWALEISDRYWNLASAQQMPEWTAADHLRDVSLFAQSSVESPGGKKRRGKEKKQRSKRKVKTLSKRERKRRKQNRKQGR